MEPNARRQYPAVKENRPARRRPVLDHQWIVRQDQSLKMSFLWVLPGTKMAPMTTVAAAMMIGYHRPP